MITNFVEWLFKWQALLGAALGGIIGLLSALIVAKSARRREDVSAAMVLSGNLTKVVFSYQVLLEQSEDKGVPEEKRHLWLAEKRAKYRPTLSPMFEASVARVMPVNGRLASHLELFRLIYADIDSILYRIADDYRVYKSRGSVPRSQEEMNSDAKRATSGFDIAVQHAICAEHLLAKLILCHTPSFNRLRMLLWRTKRERCCKELLKTGALNQTLQTDCLHATRAPHPGVDH